MRTGTAIEEKNRHGGKESAISKVGPLSAKHPERREEVVIEIVNDVWGDLCRDHATTLSRLDEVAAAEIREYLEEGARRLVEG